jgi:hypothetical protein
LDALSSSFTAQSSNNRLIDMVDDRELWSFAMALLRQDPDDGTAFTVDRMDALERAGREANISVWKEVADRINAHVVEGVQPPIDQ